MIPLYKNIRLYVLLFSVALSGLIYWRTAATTPFGSLRAIRLTEYYALIAAGYLYIVLMIGPMIFMFKTLPYRSQLFRSRRALGVSVFYFACLHAYFAFFNLLGGFAGLSYLTPRYLIAILLSFSALLILAAMTGTSFDKAVAKLSFKKWKLLHRFVYLAGLLILTHALLLGTHFADLNTLIPRISFLLLAILFILEAQRFDAYLKTKWPTMPTFGFSLLLVMAAVLAYAIGTLTSSGSGLSLSVHAEHLAALQQQATSPSAVAKRFTVSVSHSEKMTAGKDVTLTFQVFDAGSGSAVRLFTPVYEKLLHLIVVDQSLTHFQHLHPTLTDTGFTITTRFPTDGLYRLYSDFQPLGSPEQQIGTSLTVGKVSAAPAVPAPDTTLSKTIDGYTVSIATKEPLSATKLLGGQQTVLFTVTNAATGQPVTTLKPYLGAFGHVTLINQATFEYLHIHPTSAVVSTADASSGPTVDFIPYTSYTLLQAGTYRLFAEFNPDGELITVPFTLTIQP